MTNQERARAIAEEVLDYLDEPGIIEPIDATVRGLRLNAALVLVLADISERLEALDDTLGAIYTDGVGVG